MFSYLRDINDLSINTKIKKEQETDNIPSGRVKRDVRLLRVIHSAIFGATLIMFVIYLALEFKQGKSEHLVVDINLHNSIFSYSKGPYTPLSNFLHSYTLYIPIIIYISVVLVMYIIPIVIELDRYSKFEYRSSLFYDKKEEDYYSYDMDLYYITLLFNGTNIFYYILDSVAGSILLWTILQLSGIHNILLIMGVIIINIIINMSGLYNHEIINSGLTLLPDIIKEDESKNDEQNVLNKNVFINWTCYIIISIIPTLFISTLLIAYISLYEQYSWAFKATTISYSILIIITKIIIPFIFYVRIPRLDKSLLYTRNRNYYISKIITHGLLYIVPLIFITVLSQ